MSIDAEVDLVMRGLLSSILECDFGELREFLDDIAYLPQPEGPIALAALLTAASRAGATTYVGSDEPNQHDTAALTAWTYALITDWYPIPVPRYSYFSDVIDGGRDAQLGARAFAELATDEAFVILAATAAAILALPGGAGLSDDTGRLVIECRDEFFAAHDVWGDRLDYLVERMGLAD